MWKEYHSFEMTMILTMNKDICEFLRSLKLLEVIVTSDIQLHVKMHSAIIVSISELYYFCVTK